MKFSTMPASTYWQPKTRFTFWSRLTTSSRIVLLVDIENSGCQGLRLSAIVRQRPECASLPIILIKSGESTRDEELIRHIYAEAILAKPVAQDLLLATTEALAQRYRSRQRAKTNRHDKETLEHFHLQQLRSAIDQHAIVSVTDVEGNIVHVNGRFCAISGYSREELLGQNHRLVKSGLHTSEFYVTLWRTISAGQTWRGEVCNRRKNGELYWVEATIVPLLDNNGKPQQYISIRTDITALKHHEEELRISDERLRRSQVFANIGTWDWNIRTGDLYWSERIAPLFGYPSGELETSYANFLNAVHPDDRQSVSDAVNACIEHDIPYEIEHRVLWPDGRVHWLQERGAVVRDAAGNPEHMLGVVQDVHQRKLTEEALIAAREDAERANQAKSDFLSSMSHELRTPMNAIIGFAQMLEYDSDLNPDQKDDVHEIIKAGRHLLELINQVLDLSKIEAGHIDLSLEPVGVARLVEDCRQLIQPQAAARRIVIDLDVPTETAVRADRVRLKQVLLNLLSNAVKYNREGGHIRLSVQPIAVERFRIMVTDTGAGIAPKHIGELFQPFKRLEAEHSEIEGTGIGLSITKQLVEMMGGEVGVDSQVGVGSTFWIELPTEIAIMPDRTVGIADAALQLHASTRQHCVLCIDDNPVNLKLIAHMLGKRQHIHLITAHTPGLGIELAFAHRPELILLDINMPDMDGFQVLNVLKADARLKYIPVVAISANAMSHDIERGRGAGFADYLTKPLDLIPFLRTVDRYLANGAGREA